MHRLDTVRQARRRHEQALLRRANVVGCGVAYKVTEGETTDTLSVVVYVRRKVPREALLRDDLIPSRVDDVPTDVVEVGEVVALAYTGRERPARGGNSCGHFQITAGTLGVVARRNGNRVILSNCHVLANSNNAKIGDPIYQPGPADGGGAADTIAGLIDYAPIVFAQAPGTCPSAKAIVASLNFAGRAVGSRHRFLTYTASRATYNIVDCAIALPNSDDLVSDEIIGIGMVSGIREAELGLPVRKSGRTTELTHGEITGLDVAIQVGYPGGRYAQFREQITTREMAAGGDSGSLLVDGGWQRAVGLLFAGGTGITFFNPIDAVLGALAIQL